MRQRIAKRELRKRNTDSLAVFTRRRLDRWQIPLLRGWRTRRAFEVAQRLNGMVPPRIIAAIIRTWFNGWCTARRFQRRDLCIFGCQSQDSIEHYCCCPVVADFGRRHLNLEQGEHPLEQFLLLSGSLKHCRPAKLACQSAWIAATYITHCRWTRRGGPRPTAETLGQIFCELTRITLALL